MPISIRKSPIPAGTMLERYAKNGAYADCYRTDLPQSISFPEFIFAFYTTPLFKLERVILKLVVAKPSTDVQAKEIAEGAGLEFAAWKVEGRSENELLMCDFRGHTRSWFMITSRSTDFAPRTRLYFGSAVVPRLNPKTGKKSIGPVYRALLGFHQIYSILLLYSARLSIQHHKK